MSSPGDSTTPADLSGLVPAVTGDQLPATFTGVPISSSFGTSLTTLKKSKGANSTDVFLVASDPLNKSLYMYLFNAGTNTFTLSDAVKYSSLTLFSQGSYSIAGSGNTVNFGSVLVDAGDLNGDGFSDLLVSVASMKRDDGLSVTDQGGYLVLFGGDSASASGLRIRDASNNYLPPSANANTTVCYTKPDPTTGTPESFCNPMVFFLPQPYSAAAASAFPRNGKYERTWLSPHSVIGALNLSATRNPNESDYSNLSTVLLGSPGRDGIDIDSTTRILKGGVWYVLP
ncbi:MAG: hypothetical protein EBX52_10405 [Proteobacteria bacterium]|nr:hypothetical protein [Pseudomonadota bacterium]